MSNPAISPASGRPSLAVALLVAGTAFMELLDGTIITTAAPRMAESFSVAAVDINVGISAYLLTLALLIPISGWVTERLGPRPVFAAAIAIFTVASILCGLCDGLWSFTAARVLQGAGGALMVPVGRLVVLRNAAKSDLVRLVAILTWPGLVAPILGPPVGGFITTYASWRWIFYLNVPLGAVAFLLALWLIRDVERPAARPFDAIGFLLIGLASLSLMAGLEQLGGAGAGPLAAGGLLAVSAVAGWAAVRHANRAPHPLLSFEALRVPTFAVTVWGGSAFRIAINAIPFLMPLMFQLAFGLSAYRAGLLVLAIFAGNLAIKPVTTSILRRLGFRNTLIASGLINVVTMLSYVLFTPATPLPVILGLLFIGGMSRSMQYTAINTIAFADTPKEGMSTANTLFAVIQQFAHGLAIALAAVVLRAAEALAPGDTLWQFHAAFAAMAVVALAALLDVLRLAPDAGAHVSGHRRPAAAMKG